MKLKRFAVTVLMLLLCFTGNNFVQAEDMEVLFEETVEKWDVGHTPNYLKVYVDATGRHNEIVRVRITDIHLDGLLGVPE